jgi:hypothetical protein
LEITRTLFFPGNVPLQEPFSLPDFAALPASRRGVGAKSRSFHLRAEGCRAAVHLKDILSPAVTNRFDSTIAEKNTCIDDMKATYWLRIKVQNPKWEKLVLRGHFMYQDLQLYVPDGNGGYLRKRVGLDFPFREREVQYIEPIFELPDAGPGVQTYYVRLTGNLNLGIACLILLFQQRWRTLLEPPGGHYGVPHVHGHLYWPTGPARAEAGVWLSQHGKSVRQPGYVGRQRPRYGKCPGHEHHQHCLPAGGLLRGRRL